jgi:hypothetical protein
VSGFVSPGRFVSGQNDETLVGHDTLPSGLLAASRMRLTDDKKKREVVVVVVVTVSRLDKGVVFLGVNAERQRVLLFPALDGQCRRRPRLQPCG